MLNLADSRVTVKTFETQGFTYNRFCIQVAEVYRIKPKNIFLNIWITEKQTN